MLETALLVDFGKTPDGSWYTFRVKARAQGEFPAAIAALKTLPLAGRDFDGQTRRWVVRICDQTEQLLAETFANGRQCLETVKAQLPLF
jgi:hypothetical protein